MQVVAVRYLHTAYRSGLHVGNQITCKAYLLRSLTDTEPLKDQSRKKVFKKRKFRQARTLHWVSVSYRRGKKRYLTSSGSDINSSDELLKPIYEQIKRTILIRCKWLSLDVGRQQILVKKSDKKEEFDFEAMEIPTVSASFSLVKNDNESQTH